MLSGAVDHEKAFREGGAEPQREEGVAKAKAKVVVAGEAGKQQRKVDFSFWRKQAAQDEVRLKGVKWRSRLIFNSRIGNGVGI